jgi:drug/metabolite transporter (DMT)-like permease
MGLFFAVLAIVGWGVGDFLIQRSVRKLGDWEALFFITLFATVVLLPFVYSDIAQLSSSEWLVLTGTSILILVAALFDFEALRVGKISIIEPVYAMEVPVTIALTTLLIREMLSPTQLTLIAVLLLGVFLISNKHLGRIHVRTLERGVLAAVVATVGMGASNFLFGFASRASGPLMINWFTSAFMAAATILYLLWGGEGHKIMRQWRANKRLILAVGLADNTAWVAYSATALYMPIGLATGMTESYIALAAVLGMVYNAERLRIHQHVGLVLAVGAVILLAFISPV